MNDKEHAENIRRIASDLERAIRDATRTGLRVRFDTASMCEIGTRYPYYVFAVLIERVEEL